MKQINEVIKNMPVKLTADQRRKIITTAAVAVFKDGGITRVTHASVANRCDILTSAITVRKYYPTKESLWELVAKNDPTKQARKQIDSLGG